MNSVNKLLGLPSLWIQFLNCFDYPHYKSGLGIRSFTHSLIAHLLIAHCSFAHCSFTHPSFAQIKWATVSESLRSLMTNEQLWAICSGHSWKMSKWENSSFVGNRFIYLRGNPTGNCREYVQKSPSGVLEIRQGLENPRNAFLSVESQILFLVPFL